jgi:hypothetical protein
LYFPVGVITLIIVCDRSHFLLIHQATSPACTELEVITTDWLGKMLALPEEFLHSGPGNGGGVIQVMKPIVKMLKTLAGFKTV